MCSVFQTPNPTNDVYFTASCGKSTSFRPKNFKENHLEIHPFQLKRLGTNIIGGIYF
jgi:hypothetical protein